MALTVSSLSPTNMGNGNKVWHYTTDDLHTAVIADGYFDSVSDQMRKGDVILAVVDMDGTEQCRVYGVTDWSDGDVTISQVTNA